MLWIGIFGFSLLESSCESIPNVYVSAAVRWFREEFGKKGNVENSSN